jgi:hypothetical protein
MRAETVLYLVRYLIAEFCPASRLEQATSACRSVTIAAVVIADVFRCCSRTGCVMVRPGRACHPCVNVCAYLHGRQRFLSGAGWYLDLLVAAIQTDCQ